MMHAKSTAKIINRKFGIRHYVSVNNGVSVLLPSGDFVQACGVVWGPHISGVVRSLSWSYFIGIVYNRLI